MEAFFCQGIINGLNTAHENNVIHRALKPENILIMNNIPKIINFDLSYQYDENELEHLTVIDDPSKITDDGYTAPEVLVGKDIDERTDYFSLGVIAYELFTGTKPFGSVKELNAKGGQLTAEHLKTLREKRVLVPIISVVQKMIIADRDKRNVSGKEIFEAFSTDLYSGDSKNQVLNIELLPETKYDVYEIINLVGKGVEAQIYKAHTLHAKNVAIKLFNKEVPFERIDHEARVLEAIKSSYVVKCDRIGYWNKDRYFISMDYIDGTLLRMFIDKGERPDWQTFKVITQCMVEAIKAFHLHQDEDGSTHPFLHSDIKPDNILVTADQKAVLIDCGIAGEPRVGVFQGTIGYVPPDCIVGSEREYVQDGDLFALGVTLWEWLFGVKPYENPYIGAEPCLPLPLNAEFPSHISDWLCQAVATNKSKRFSSIKEMETCFHKECQPQEATIEGKSNEEGNIMEPEQGSLRIDFPVLAMVSNENLFVNYLNTLTNASAGNENAIAEAQINNKYFAQIFVNNPLTDFVYKELIDNRKNVILTGNAGDGKTTIAAEIYRKIVGKFDIMESRIELDKERLVIIKDMSELKKDEQIGVLEEAILDNNRVFLLVANTGVLIESGAKVQIDGIESFSIKNQLLNEMASNSPNPVLNNRFILINIARTDSINTACEVFKNVINTDEWESCQKCGRNCPVYLNIKMIRENEETVLKRIEMLYRRLYEYGIRLTMRQMIGHLSYSLTSGKACSDLKDYTQLTLEKKLSSLLFINRFFGDDGGAVQPEALQLDPVRQIRTHLFGSGLEPSFERLTWTSKESALPIYGEEAKKIQKELFKRLDSSGSNGRMQVRRLAYFLGCSDGINGSQFLLTFMRSPMLEEYLKICRSGQRFSSEYNYRVKILQVLQEYFIGMRLTEGSWDKVLYITLNRQGFGGRTQMVIADFRENDFELRLIPEGKLSKTYTINLICKKGMAMMKLDLPFLDYVMHRHQGEVAGELSSYYADRLEKFKIQLSKLYVDEGYFREHSFRLLRVLPNRKFEILNLQLENGNLEVLG